MNHITFSEQSEYPLCILTTVLNKKEIKETYLDPFGISEDDVVILSLHQSATAKKTPVKEMKEYIISELQPVLDDLKVQHILCADAEYFKVLSKSPKADSRIGYVCDSVFGNQKINYVPNYKAVFYDPLKVKAKIALSIQSMIDYCTGVYKDPGDGIIKVQHYPMTEPEIKMWLDKLLAMNCPLTVDIEAFSLKHVTSGIGTITFCWNKHEGVAFPVDCVFGSNNNVRGMLKEFFIKNQQKLIYHNISFDVYILIYQLFMSDILDTTGLLEGLQVMLKNFDCTKIITYLATNSCAGNKLGLKDQAQEYAGDYAVEDIKDIRKIAIDELLTYNLVDGLSTWYVHEKNYPKMVADDQLDIYENLFKPALKDIIQMQLTGMPIDMGKVKEARDYMEKDCNTAIQGIQGHPKVAEFLYLRAEKWAAIRNAKLVKKRVTVNDFKEPFNPRSPIQLQEFLFKFLGLPVLSLTDTKQPSTDGDTLEKLTNHTDDPATLSFLKALMDFKAVDKILTSFIPAMEAAVRGPDGWHYLFGNFNLGGTVSGRLSSNNPNLQNLPATGSDYAKIIKACFVAPPGWIFAGLDFASLEDRISALTTKDPNKLKVYTDGYDGHCLRAFYYFGDQMVGIVDTVESINSIAVKYKPLRQDSKAPTFALTYQGTYKTLMVNCGFSLQKAKMVEDRYHILYVVSDKWVAGKLDQACKDGYITGAFGLRVRTPLLHQVLRGTKKTPYEAEAEGRTAGNALGQSWGLLNTRASVEFMEKVRKSKHRLDIRPCAHIHDAQYYLIRDDIDTVMYMNKHLVQAVKWQDHPDIAHDEVKLGGEVSLFYPSWAKEITIPNGATKEQILDLVAEAEA